MVCISQLFMLSPRGDKIIFKDYRHDIFPNTDEVFFRKYKFWDGVNHAAPVGECPPFFVLDGVIYSFVKKNNVLIVATSRVNFSPSLLSELLLRLTKILKDYLGVLNEESIRRNFVLVYELLDELVDYGYVQETSSEKLMSHIFNEPVILQEETVAQTTLESIRTATSNIFLDKTKRSQASQMSIVTASSQRKNEVYLDVLERLNVTFSPQGNIVQSEVDGCVLMKSFLGGTPDLKLGLNEDLQVGRGNSMSKFASVCLDSVNFHENVDYSKFETERMLSFRPPDGEFVVMNYRVTTEYTMPFRILPTITPLGTYKLELLVKIRSDFPLSNSAAGVFVRVPTPRSTTSVTVEFGVGAVGQSYEYKPAEKVVIWAIKKFTGSTEHVCKIRISTSAPITTATNKEVGPISMSFEIPMHNVTGLAIKFLRIEERSKSYNPSRWVRNITQANSYVCRVT
jgi:AP-4 complex subunit mu-1